MVQVTEINTVGQIGLIHTYLRNFIKLEWNRKKMVKVHDRPQKRRLVYNSASRD